MVGLVVVVGDVVGLVVVVVKVVVVVVVVPTIQLFNLSRFPSLQLRSYFKVGG